MKYNRIRTVKVSYDSFEGEQVQGFEAGILIDLKRKGFNLVNIGAGLGTIDLNFINESMKFEDLYV